MLRSSAILGAVLALSVAVGACGDDGSDPAALVAGTTTSTVPAADATTDDAELSDRTDSDPTSIDEVGQPGGIPRRTADGQLPDPCSLFTAEEVRQNLDLDFEEPREIETSEPDQRTCSYRQRFSVNIEPVGRYDTRVQIARDAGATCQAEPGLGDRACMVAMYGGVSLFIADGDLVYALEGAGDPVDYVALARLRW